MFEDIKSLFGGAAYVGVALVLLLWAWSCVVIVREKTAVTVLRLGSYARTLSPGFRLKAPWPIEQLDHVLNLQIFQIESRITAKSKDHAFVAVPVKVQVEVIDEKAYEAAYALDDPTAQMKSYIENQIRSQAASMEVDEIFASKDSFELAVQQHLEENFGTYGYRIRNVLVDDPQLSEGMAKSYEQVLMAERAQQAATKEAEAVRIRMVGAATAEGESLEIKGKAFKEFRKLIAEGNADAMQEFLREGDGSLTARDVLDFFAGIDQRDAIRDAAAHGGKVVVIQGAEGADRRAIRSVTAAQETTA